VPDDQEREDWESLVASSGWVRFAAWAKGRYDEEFLTYIDRIVDNATDDRETREDKIRQAAAVRRAMRTALEYPMKRLKEMRRGTRSPRQRRGTL